MNGIQNMVKLDDAVVMNTAGGDGCVCFNTVANLKSGWLALRTEPYYNAANEIGHLFNGDCVQILSGPIAGKDGHTYIVVYSPKLGMQGYANAAYVC